MPFRGKLVRSAPGLLSKQLRVATRRHLHPCTKRIFGNRQMAHSKSKLSRWVTRSAFALIACAASTMVSAEQAQAQYYGGRGGGFSLTIGNGGFGNFGGVGFNNFNNFNRGYGGFNRGYGYGGGFNNFNSGYRYVPQRSYYRGGGYGGGYGGGRYRSYGRY